MESRARFVKTGINERKMTSGAVTETGAHLENQMNRRTQMPAYAATPMFHLTFPYLGVE